MEQFQQFFPANGNTSCPFGPNYGGLQYPSICYLGCGKGEVEGGEPRLWPDPQCGFFIPLVYMEETLTWAAIHREGLSVMFHMNTGCMAGDHIERAAWAGERRPVRPEMVPCNSPGSGCRVHQPDCGCDLPLPGGLGDHCQNCVPHGGDGW